MGALMKAILKMQRSVFRCLIMLYFDLRNMNPAHSFLLDRPRELFHDPTNVLHSTVTVYDPGVTGV
jgi:hypothetical protein